MYASEYSVVERVYTSRFLGIDLETPALLRREGTGQSLKPLDYTKSLLSNPT